MLKTVVVGASTGLGRCIGIGLAQRGARVAMMARRKDKLDDAAREAGEGTLAIACDVTDEASCRVAIDAAAKGLGGIDAVIYAAAIGPLVMLENADAATWRRTFDTNVIGASLITAAALPHLTASAGTALYLSTTGSSYTPPWAGLAVYQVSKAALDRLVDAWRIEHPGIGFTRVTLGECPGGEGDAQTHFNKDWNGELTGELMPNWFARGYLSGAMIDIAHLLTTLDSLLRGGASLQVPSITVIPRPTPPQL